MKEASSNPTRPSTFLGKRYSGAALEMTGVNGLIYQHGCAKGMTPYKAVILSKGERSPQLPNADVAAAVADGQEFAVH